ncbi:vWA domain-containing protein [Aestuariimicrobium ganziense]|uniref:vWA domain-containing protein n=1 Tax=Aestuariimicrobium ganziense TaxID=2773677 RepID=UPI00194426A4|nr:VWA-like domain-containing protein [Aestuariimicrobium ganziense]
MDLDKIAAAKLWLISPPVVARQNDAPRDLPYLTHALYALVAVPSNEVERMTCDEWWRIYVNPDWLDQTPVPDVAREMAHLVWHLLSDHANRARDQRVDVTNHAAWKTASDLTIRETLTLDELVPEPFPAHADDRLPLGRSAEEYFATLTRMPANGRGNDGSLPHGEGCGSGADGIRRAGELDPDAATAAVTRFEADEIRHQVAIDFQGHITDHGNVPANLLRWVRETLQPVVPWEPILARTVRRCVGWASGRGDFTYSRPSRRAGSVRGVVLPGQHRQVPKIAMVVDTSASIDDGLLSRAMAEVDGAIAVLGVAGTQVTVYSVDAEVHTAGRVSRAKDVVLAGGGGTDMRKGLEAAVQARPRPDVVVVITDGFTPWPARPPLRAPVVVALLGRRSFPRPPTPEWAVRVECLAD